MGSATRPRAVTRTAAVLVVVAAATLLTGCLNLSVHTRLEADGSGTLRMQIELSEQLVQAFGAFGGPITSEDLIEDSDTDIPAEFSDRVRFTPLDDEVGLAVEIDFRDIDELNLLLSDTSLEGEGDGLVDRVEFDNDGERVRFEAVVGGDETFSTDDEFELFFGDLAEPDVSFSVELPGAIGDTNADEVDGNTATWDLVAAAGTTIFAESGTSASLLDSPWLLAVAGAVGLLALVLLVVVVTRLRRPRTATTGNGAAPVPTIGTVPVVASSGWGATPTAAGPPSTAPPMGPAPAGTAPPGSPATGSHPPAEPSGPAGPPPLPPLVAPGASDTPPASVAAPEAGEQTATAPAGGPGDPSPSDAPGGQGAPPSGPPAGWYPDPGGGGRQRWWDGTTWTDHLG